MHTALIRLQEDKRMTAFYQVIAITPHDIDRIKVTTIANYPCELQFAVGAAASEAVLLAFAVDRTSPMVFPVIILAGSRLSCRARGSRDGWVAVEVDIM